MGIFGGRRQRGKTPAEEAARRRQAHVPATADRPESVQRASRPAPVADPFEVRVLRFSQLGFAHARTDVDAKLAPYLAAGWEVVTDDRKRYGVGGRHTITIRRASAADR